MNDSAVEEMTDIYFTLYTTMCVILNGVKNLIGDTFSRYIIQGAADSLLPVLSEVLAAVRAGSAIDTQ